MQTLLGKIASVLLVPVMFVAGILGYDQPITDTRALEETIAIQQGEIDRLNQYFEDFEQKLGATNDIPTPVALFETSLANSITSSASTMTLVSATDKDGNTLASSTYAFIIDEGTSNEEFVIADCTGTACTNMTRGVSVLSGTTTVASLQKAHRRGSSVKITDAPQLLILSRLANGVAAFPNLIKYKSSTSACSANDDICDKAYIDGVAVAGASDANTTTKGIVEIATDTEVASSTSAGGTSAPLVIRSTSATSTPSGDSASGLKVVVTKNNGKIHKSFLDLTEDLNLSGELIAGSTATSTLFKGAVRTPVLTLTDAATIDIDFSDAGTYVVTLGGNRTITFSNVQQGSSLKFLACQDGTGSRTLTWPSSPSIRWASGVVPTLTTTANKCDTVSFFTATSTTSVFGAITPNF